jgi:dolichyl-phosphate beta-glucosyltransferase
VLVEVKPTGLGKARDESGPRPEVSIVIPMYREARRIGPTLREVGEYARRSGRAIELVLVDDGSDDDTVDVATAALREVPNGTFTRSEIKLHGVNRGKGAAVRTGLAASSGQWVLCMDADGSCAASEVEKLLARRGVAGMAAGSRGMPESEVEAVAQRRMTGIAFKACLAALGMNLLRDTQCGFKLYRRDAADLIARIGQEDGYTFDLEHLLILKRAGMGVAEVGVKWKHMDGGQVRPVRDGLRMLGAAVRLRAKFRFRLEQGAGAPRPPTDSVART